MPQPFDWRQTLADLDIEPRTADAPDEAEGEWFEVLSRFTRYGFMRTLVAPSEEAVRVHTQLTLPGPGAQGYLEALEASLEASAGDWTVDSTQPPAVVTGRVDSGAAFGEALGLLATVCRHVERAEAGEAPAELAADLPSVSRRSDQGPASTDTGSEIGEADAQEQETGGAAAGGVFETIGDATASAPEGDAPGSALDLQLAGFDLRVADGSIRLRVEPATDVGGPERRRLEDALRQGLTLRFDVDVAPVGEAAGAVQLAVTPIVEPRRGGLGELSDEIARFLARVQKFGELGMSPLEVLAPRPGSARASNRSRGERRPEADAASGESRRTEPAAVAASTTEAAEAAEPGEFVFGFSSDAAAAPEERLPKGEFTDRRLMREDATTPLVDVVLRHPGYSDRRIGQVLSILLDIDYFEARQTAEQAPTIIAWSIGQERAQRFKKVIERAGGKVVLVEPDSL